MRCRVSVTGSELSRCRTTTPACRNARETSTTVIRCRAVAASPRRITPRDTVARTAGVQAQHEQGGLVAVNGGTQWARSGWSGGNDNTGQDRRDNVNVAATAHRLALCSSKSHVQCLLRVRSARARKPRGMCPGNASACPGSGSQQVGGEGCRVRRWVVAGSGGGSVGQAGAARGRHCPVGCGMV